VSQISVEPVEYVPGAVDRTVAPVFELEHVSHSYGRNKVIFDVSLKVWPGEVIGLVGDNGAGKSTLLKIFAGYQKPTGGQLKFDGRPVSFSSPAAARALGIEAVYQDLAIVNQLNLWQNFYLGKELTRRFGPISVMDRKEMRRATVESAPRMSRSGRCRVVSVSRWQSPVPTTSAPSSCCSMSRRPLCRYGKRATSWSRYAAPAARASASFTSITT
jgi:ABC-type Fe3+/spermidine/putrescine transport system ATPase subunit